MTQYNITPEVRAQWDRENAERANAPSFDEAQRAESARVDASIRSNIKCLNRLAWGCAATAGLIFLGSWGFHKYMDHKWAELDEIGKDRSAYEQPVYSHQ